MNQIIPAGGFQPALPGVEMEPLVQPYYVWTFRGSEHGKWHLVWYEDENKLQPAKVFQPTLCGTFDRFLDDTKKGAIQQLERKMGLHQRVGVRRVGATWINCKRCRHYMVQRIRTLVAEFWGGVDLDQVPLLPGSDEVFVMRDWIDEQGRVKEHAMIDIALSM